MKGPELVAAMAVGTALGAVVNASYLTLSVSVVILAVLLFSLLEIKYPHNQNGLVDVAPYAATLALVGFCRGVAWQLTGSGDGIQEWTFIQRAHSALNHAIESAGFSELATPLIKALISGDRSGISPEIKAAFRLSGASHLLALSGLHLGLIYAIISKSLAITGGHPIAVKTRSLLIIVLCGFYAVMTGATPSIMRAFLFILLRETARITGRLADPLTTFSTALMIHLVLAPGSIQMPGFQLSYLAMCGIYLLFPRLSAIYPASKYDPLKKIWDIATLSISCQAFTAPAAWFHFHSFPQWFLLTNMIAMPISTLLMLLAILTITLSSLSGMLGSMFGTSLCPHSLTSTVDLLASTLTSAVDLLASALTSALSIIASL